MLDRARRGDRGALELLLTSHYDRVHALCRRMLGNDADALDATQEALLAVVRAIGRFDGRSSFGTWIYRIAANACIDEMRRRRRRPVVGLPLDGHDHVVGGPRGLARARRSETSLWVETEAPAGSSGVSGRAVAHEASSEARASVARASVAGPVSLASQTCDPAETAAARIDVDAALARLTTESRTAIVLRDFYDLPYKEIAEVLGIPIGTVRSRIARARATLADLLSSGWELGPQRSELTLGSDRNQDGSSDVQLGDDDANGTTVDVRSRRAAPPRARFPVNRESQP